MFTKKQAIKLIEPHFPLIEKSGHEAYSEFRESYLNTGLAVNHKNRTLSNIINDLLITKLKENFASVRGVVFIKKHGVDLMYFSDLIRVRVKKIDSKSYLPSNVVTGHSLQLFNDPELRLFPEKVTTLVLGYTTDESRSIVRWPFLVLTDGMRNIHWVVTQEEIAESLMTESTTVPEKVKTTRQKKKKIISIAEHLKEPKKKSSSS
ncbi:hypothetical protein EFP84_18890 [Leptospira kmetyi]|uniref:Uncharacterized protein n=1 Tax=Leptospira kmetyi TaxID=408139 RepID=A0AAD0USL7_9LEPT|nr:hypothetical protein [Leptospira kmetyi]AYV57707.1 hypothetical protein EFP84_18890 [Leptospira kmetyi]